MFIYHEQCFPREIRLECVNFIGSKTQHLSKVFSCRHHLVTRAVPCKDSSYDLLAAMSRLHFSSI